MRFLVDAQLPPALARFLVEHGHEAQHVADVGLSRAPDHAIWNHAKSVNAVLVTKDQDFVTMRALSAEPAPAVIWVRIGNATKRVSIERFSAALPALVEALERGETVVQMSD